MPKDVTSNNVQSADMPVEAQEKAHAAVITRTARPVLEPGRTEPINKGLIGEFEVMLMDAEKIGDHARAAMISNLMGHLGNFVRFANDVDDDLKALCKKVSSLIK